MKHQQVRQRHEHKMPSSFADEPMHSRPVTSKSPVRKSSRGVGVLLAILLVLPAPALTACRGGAEVARESERVAEQAARQKARDIAKRGGPLGGTGGVGGGACAQSESCP
jgi:hypothetical protein